MASNWKTYSLGDIADIGSSKRIKMADYVSKGVPFFRSKEIIEKHKGNAISTELFITEEQFSSIKAKFSAPCEGDILLTSVGTLGVPYQVQCDDRFYFKDGNLTWFRNFKDVVNSRYIYFWLTSALAKRKIDEVTIGSTQQALTIVALKSITIDLPPISIQNAIIKHIDSISRKITLNRQINQTLEQMAQTLFKSWFVDFDPVIDNALDAGNPIPDELQHRAEARKAVRESEGFKPLPDDVRQLFPDAFEESELGWVPKGWGSKNLTMLVDTISKTYPLKTVDEVIFLNTGDIEDGRFLHTDFSKVAGLPGQAKKSIQRNDILFSEIRPKNKRFAYVNFDAKHHVVSTKLMVLRAKQDVHPLFAYFLLTLEKTTNELQRIAELRSGTFPQITYTELGLISFSLPNDTKLIDAFVGLYLQPFYDKSFKSREENETLTKLRDTLLPKLISGELRLDDIELAVEQEAVSAEQQNER
ncbi:restriction endonuclease subunit S [Vibrio cholerae]|nr:restriction endonuclease subunit S [Vibrio cholerae]